MQIKMSVWKKASKANQKTHRERHQPESRKHLGLLEKKKDYVRRAQDYNDKQASLKVLRKRALNKNPDEFYHHMINAKVTKDGVHHEKDTSKEHTTEQLQIMQTQDVRYVNMKRVQEMKRIERLQSQLHLIDVDKPTNHQHKYFFDSRKDAEEFTKRKCEAQDEMDAVEELDVNSVVESTKRRENMYKELASRIKREKELSVVQQKLEIKQYLETKKKCFPPKKIQDASKDTPPVYKWKTQRKR